MKSTPAVIYPLDLSNNNYNKLSLNGGTTNIKIERRIKNVDIPDI